MTRFCSNCVLFDKDTDFPTCRECIDDVGKPNFVLKCCSNCQHEDLSLLEVPCKGCSSNRDNWTAKAPAPVENPRTSRMCCNCAYIGISIHDPQCAKCVNDDAKPNFKLQSHLISADQAEDDPVNPSHYNERAIQPADYSRANGLNFCEGNIIKYVTRHRFKGGVTDLKKARQYLDWLIEDEEKK